ncbi:MAG TPA: hypothetical protein VLT83_02955 [Opitutaceae bacterium]|nr:hypothetical protein [Opitutaceae bacterium]
MNGPTISVTRPVDLALARVRQILFRPFNPGKWFVIGFCAWLAYLGQGGMNFNFNFGRGHRGNVGDVHEAWEKVRDFVVANLYWLLPLVAAAVVFGFAVWLLFTWLHSRGEFMFLHCVALDRAEVEVPWGKFAREGNSLFVFRLVVGLASAVVIWPPLILCVVRFFRMAVDDAWSVSGVLLGLGWFLMMLTGALLFLLIKKFTADFVVPIMYRRRLRCGAGWAVFWDLLAANFGQMIVYLLFQIVLVIVIGFIVLAAVLVTCCCAGCLLALPYLGTVLLLPVLIFKRAYSIHYLAQYGPDFDVFAPGEPPALHPTPPAA